MTLESKKFMIPMRTQYGKTGLFCNIQFGKPVKLPFIRSNAQMSTRQQNETIVGPFISQQKNKENLLKQKTLTIQQFYVAKKSMPDILPILKSKSDEHSIQKQMQRVKSERNMSLHPLEMVGAYRLGAVIGKGSGAVVRMVKNWKGGVFAMKTYQKFNQYDCYKRRNVQNQIEILSSLDHPSVLKFVQTISSPTSINIITQIIQKKSLGQWLKTQQNGRATQQQLKTILFNILSKGISHRDIKLDNILISRDLSIKLIDFGFSTKTNQILYDFCGTPHYMSPQIISRGGYVGESADVWALGVLAFKLATGGFPFKAMNDKILFRKICRADVQYPQYVHDHVQRIINKMLQLDYTQRPKASQILKDNWFAK